MMNTERLCVRCDYPVGPDDRRCAFCQWEHADPGVECMCGYVNKAIAKFCKACRRVL